MRPSRGDSLFDFVIWPSLRGWGSRIIRYIELRIYIIKIGIIRVIGLILAVRRVRLREWWAPLVRRGGGLIILAPFSL